MVEIKDRIISLRMEKGMTQGQLAEALDISSSSIGMYEQGRRKPSYELLEKISDYFNVDMDYLMGRSDIKNKYQAGIPYDWEKDLKKINLTSNAVILDKSQFIYVPVYGKASAGNGYINMETVLYDKLVHINGYSHDSFLIEVSGDSMEPTIIDGEFVLVDPTFIEICEGKIYVITYNGETFIKMIEKHEEDEIVLLKSINQKYRDKVIRKEEFESVKIEGRVVKVISERNL